MAKTKTNPKKKGTVKTLMPKKVVKQLPAKKNKIETVGTYIVADSPQFIPTYETAGAACVDLVANIPFNEYNATLDPETKLPRISITSRTTAKVDCGFSMELPEGYKACIVARSSKAKLGLVVPNSPGQVDSDYRGRVSVLLTNIGKEILTIGHGERFAQMYIEPVYKFNFVPATELSKTARGDGGFGSTGVKK